MSSFVSKARAARAAILEIELHALLIKLGPTDQEDLRERLFIASPSRFSAAVNGLVRHGICSRAGKALRLVDDVRPQPKRSLDAWYRTKREAA